MPKERRALRIESAGQKIECDAAAVCAQGFGVAQTGERMIIGNEIKRFALGLERDGRLHHAKIIADVQRTAWLNTGQNAHHSILDMICELRLCDPLRKQSVFRYFSCEK